ncbi:MAG: SRPBCC family protein [Thalassovita sp.]
MATVIVSKTVEAPISSVWKTWDNFGDIDTFNPALKQSFLIDGSAHTGLGAKRQCDLADGKNYIREEIVGYTTEKQIKINIYDGSVPLKKALATFDFVAPTARQTKVTMTMTFTPKFGLLGLLLIPLMKPQFKKDMAALLDANATHVEKTMG